MRPSGRIRNSGRRCLCWFLSRHLFAPQRCGRPPAHPGPGARAGPVGRAAGLGGLDAGGESGSGFGGLRPAPAVTPGSGRPGRTSGRAKRVRARGRKKEEPNPEPEPRRLRSRAPRPVPPSPARSGLGPGRAGGRPVRVVGSSVGGRSGLGLGVRCRRAWVGCRGVAVAGVWVVFGCAGVSVRPVWVSAAWVAGVSGWSVGSSGSGVGSWSVGSSGLGRVSGGVGLARRGCR